ncbi:MAG TPA: outer membrane lipoprotein-sorting protein [Opitutaceae bacterium]|jgi:hypothetical protein
MKRFAAFLLALAAAGAGLAAPPTFSPPTSYGGQSTLNESQTAEALDAFRAAGPARPSYLEFDLRHLPRRGAETVFHGQLWASRNEDGAVYRIDIVGGAHFLLQNGSRAKVWRAEGGAVTEVPSTEPLAPGLEIDAFDLQRPYLYWPLAGPVAVAPDRGRPSDVFLFHNPSPGGIAAVRAFLDSEYHAPVDVECQDAKGGLVRTFSLLDLKKVSGQWLPKDIDARDEATHNKTRFSLTGAALGLDLSPSLFEPANLAGPAEAPAGVERF